MLTHHLSRGSHLGFWSLPGSKVALYVGVPPMPGMAPLKWNLLAGYICPFISRLDHGNSEISHLGFGDNCPSSDTSVSGEGQSDPHQTHPNKGSLCHIAYISQCEGMLSYALGDSLEFPVHSPVTVRCVWVNKIYSQSQSETAFFV